VQVVEDVEEYILRLLLTSKELYIIDDEHVHQLVELCEVSNGVVLHRFDELLGELLGRNVEDGLVWMVFLDLDADGMHKVRFTEAHPAVDEQRIEGRAAGLLRYGISCTACQSVAVPFDEVVEGVVGVEVTFDLDLAQAGNDERILDRAVGNVDRETYGRITHIAGIARGHLHRIGVGALESVLHDDGVFQATFIPQFLLDDLLKQSDVVFLQPFVEEL
jgi:hypothetical protein